MRGYPGREWSRGNWCRRCGFLATDYVDKMGRANRLAVVFGEDELHLVTILEDNLLPSPQLLPVDKCAILG